MICNFEQEEGSNDEPTEDDDSDVDPTWSPQEDYSSNLSQKLKLIDARKTSCEVFSLTSVQQAFPADTDLPETPAMKLKSNSYDEPTEDVDSDMVPTLSPQQDHQDSSNSLQELKLIDARKKSCGISPLTSVQQASPEAADLPQVPSLKLNAEVGEYRMRGRAWL